MKVPSYKISAKTGEGVNEVFLKIIENIQEYQKKCQ